MKTSIPWLWQHRQHIPVTTFWRLIFMSGLNAINSKLRYLKSVSVEKAKGRQVSVVYMDEDGQIDWPQNPNQNGGCLVVPRALTMKRWIEKYGRHVV
jgi:hypothetical protein